MKLVNNLRSNETVATEIVRSKRKKINRGHAALKTEQAGTSFYSLEHLRALANGPNKEVQRKCQKRGSAHLHFLEDKSSFLLALCNPVCKDQYRYVVSKKVKKNSCTFLEEFWQRRVLGGGGDEAVVLVHKIPLLPIVNHL